MNMAVYRITAAAESDYALRVGGDLAVTHVGGAVQSATDFGGRLALSGRDLLLDTRVDMPSGVFEAVATGGNLTLGDAASLNAKGSAVDFRDVVRVTSGGTIRLAATGDLSLASGAALAVAGRKRVVWGKSVSVRVELGCCGIIK